MPSQFSRTTRSLSLDTSRYALIAWGIAGVCLLFWLLWFVFGGVTVYETSRKARLEVRQAPHPVASLVSGKLAQSYMVIGAEVHAGDLLLELDSEAIALRLKEEESRRDSFAPKIALLRQEIAAQEEAVADGRRSAMAAGRAAEARTREVAAAATFANDYKRRLNEESKAGGIAEIDALRAASEYNKLSASKDAFASDLKKIDYEAGVRNNQTRAQIANLERSVISLEGELATSEVTISRLRLEIERHRIRAAVDGRVGDVLTLKPGAYVAEGEKLATLIPEGDLIIVAEFNPSTALGRLRPGQDAWLRLDGFPWAQYGSIHASVVRVASEVRDNALRVEMQPLSSLANAQALRHGLPGTADIRIETISPLLMALRITGQWLTQGAAPDAGHRQ